MAEAYLSDIAGSEDKEELMAYKQTFMLVMQNLFAYRYRIPSPERMKQGMCQLCKISEWEKELRRREGRELDVSGERRRPDYWSKPAKASGLSETFETTSSDSETAVATALAAIELPAFVAPLNP